jgi:undecaprenyl-diphosphatase
MNALLNLDVVLFHAINSWHAPWADALMSLVSAKWSWLPAYLLLLVALYRRFGWRRVVLILVCVGGLITFTDRISAGVLKPQVQRLRPCHAALAVEVHLVDGHCGGQYGFVSSHAANFFGLATLMSLLFGRSRLTLLFLAIATLAGYSRVYLGVHYPGDVLGGALLGGLGGGLFFAVYRGLTRWLHAKLSN